MKLSNIKKKKRFSDKYKRKAENLFQMHPGDKKGVGVIREA